jgi:hypothetical protein
MATAKRRTEQLRAAVKEFMLVHDTWAADNNRNHPDESYDDALERMATIFEEGEIPGDCRQLAVKVRALLDKWDDFCEERDSGERQYPANEFWTAREQLLKVFSAPEERPTFKPLESIPLLEKQNVPHRIIAKIYGLFDADGNPEAHLVQRELDKPGSVIGPDWVDPRVLAWEAERAERESHADELVAKHHAAAEAAKRPECPESIHDLWEQGVSAKQAARMLGKFANEVQAEFSKFDAEREDVREDTAETKEGGKGKLSDEVKELIYLHADEEMTVEQIAAELQLKPRQVAKVLKDRPAKVEA